LLELLELLPLALRPLELLPFELLPLDLLPLAVLPFELELLELLELLPLELLPLELLRFELLPLDLLPLAVLPFELELLELLELLPLDDRAFGGLEPPLPAVLAWATSVPALASCEVSRHANEATQKPARTRPLNIDMLMGSASAMPILWRVRCFQRHRARRLRAAGRHRRATRHG
jgi:hypothetical protein